MLKTRLMFIILVMTKLMGIYAGSDSVEHMNRYREFQLVPGEIYRIKVKKDDGVTTVTFPSAISRIAGVNVAANGSGDFLIAAKAGSHYFSLVALKPGVSGTLTVVYNRKTYILYLVHDAKEADAAVNFTGSSSGGRRMSGGNGVTPARLLSLIDLSKAYDLLLQRYPHELRDSTRAKIHRIFDFGKFTIELKEVIRYNAEDTLVFKLLMHNPSEEEILYDKFSFSARVAGKSHPMSAADASGIMPPKSATWAFFAITGTPTGGRNNFAPDNDFIIGVTAKYMEEEFRSAGDQRVSAGPSPDTVRPDDLVEGGEQ